MTRLSLDITPAVASELQSLRDSIELNNRKLEAYLNSPAWIEVTTFLNSWVNYGAGYPTAAYRKIGDIVYLKGLLKLGTVSVAAFTLPVEYRPSTNRHFITMMTAAAGGLRINTDGSVTFGDPGGGGNGYCSLDGIHFETSG